LDEATSALDYLAERQVSENLSQVFQDRTVFFITHRLKSLQSADVILMMDQGKIVEQGTHDELMALRSLYYCLYQQQEMQA
jgi:ATP-binding cassette, subfamily B, bacterial HlyB/CyaB